MQVAFSEDMVISSNFGTKSLSAKFLFYKVCGQLFYPNLIKIFKKIKD